MHDEIPDDYSWPYDEYSFDAEKLKHYTAKVNGIPFLNVCAEAVNTTAF